MPDRQGAASAQAAGEPGAPVPDETDIVAEAGPVTAFWRDLGRPGRPA